MAERWPEVRFSIGVHPHAAGKFAGRSRGVLRVRSTAAIAGQPLTRGLGEIGLDYHYDFAPRDVQQQVFREQIRLARQRRLPIVIHTREAEEDTFRILAEESAGEVGGVFHCFTGDRDMARRALDTRVSHLARRDRDVSARARAARSGEDRAARSAAHRNRQPVSRAGAAPRHAERAGARRARRGGDRRGCAGRRARRSALPRARTSVACSTRNCYS